MGASGSRKGESEGWVVEAADAQPIPPGVQHLNGENVCATACHRPISPRFVPQGVIKRAQQHITADRCDESPSALSCVSAGVEDPICTHSKLMMPVRSRSAALFRAQVTVQLPAVKTRWSVCASS